MSPTTMKSN